MPPSKKRKLATGDDDSLGNVSIDEEGGHDESMNNSEDDNRDVMSIEGSENSQSPHNSEMDSPDTEEEIAFSKMKKSKKTAKRKIRATSPTQFGSTLETLLGTSVPSSAPLALKPSIQRKRKNEKQDVVMRRTLESQKKEHEEMGRVTDVIGGWGGENERSLRKVAQRGVVQLFNVIQKAQVAKVTEENSKLALRGTGKPTLDAPNLNSKGKGKRKSIISERGNAAVEKDVFMDAIRAGGVVSKF